MGLAVNARFAHGGMTVEHGFNLLGKYFPAREIDDGRLAREQKQKSVSVQSARCRR